MVIRYASALLTITGVLALLLGFVLWSGNGFSLVSMHMLLGLLAVIALAVIAVRQAVTKGGSWLLAGCALVVALLTVVIGMKQAALVVGDRHWIVQVVHLVLGILTIGLGHMAAARAKRNG